MQKFNYYAKDAEGNSKKGVVEAVDRPSAAGILKERNLVLISIESKSEGLLTAVKKRIFTRIGLNDLVNFTRQLSTMISAGLVITDAFTILRTQTENPNMAVLVDSLQRDIEGGSSFSAALKKYPGVFDPVYIALVRSGETAGILDKILARLADNLESRREFVSKVKGAMIYPIIIIGGMFLVGLIMMIFVIPKLLDLYREFEATLPLPTIILMSLSKFLTKFWWLALILMTALFLGGKKFAKTDIGRLKLDSLFFAVPIIGKLRKSMILTEFTRTLGLLISGGVLVVDALNVTVGAMGSAIYQKAVLVATRDVEKGSTLAISLAKSEVFPPLLPQMVSVGEETGKLDEVLLKISSYFQQEAEVAVRNLTSAVEPIIMVILGLGVGFLIIAVIMPIYNLTSQF